MSDREIDLSALVERLADYGGPADIIKDCRQASDEIERLRAVNAELLAATQRLIACVDWDDPLHQADLKFARTAIARAKGE